MTADPMLAALPDGPYLPDGGEARVNSTTPDVQFNPAITWLADGLHYVVVWTSAEDAAEMELRGRIFSADGSPVGDDFLINPDPAGGQIDAQLAALSGGGFVVVWLDTSPAFGSEVRAQRFDSTGASVGAEIFVTVSTATAFQSWPSVAAFADDSFVITWVEDGGSAGTEVKAQILDADGSFPAGTAFDVNQSTDAAQDQPSVAVLADGSFVVVWRDGSGTGGDADSTSIKSRLYQSDGTPVGGETPVNSEIAGTQELPVVAALAGGGYVVAWQDWSATGGDTSQAAIRARVFDAEGNRLGGELLVNTGTAGSQLSPAVVALPDGGFVVSWTDADESFADAEIRAQRFDAEGNAVASEFTVNSDSTGFQEFAAAAASPVDGHLAVAWLDYGDGSDPALYDIEQRLFHLNRAPVLAVPLADHHCNEDAAFSHQIPADSFTDADGDTLAYSATLANGDPLPSWLAFDAATRTFSGTPPTDFNGTLSIEMIASDGAAIASDLFDLVIDPVNDAPAIQGFAGASGYSEGSPPHRLDWANSATLSDPDSADFDGGTLTVTISGSGADPGEDEVLLDPGYAPVTLSGGQVVVDGHAIGAYSGGTGGVPFSIAFNSAATPQRVQEVLHALAYRNTDDVNPTVGTRLVTAVVTDGDGGTSAPVSWGLGVIRVNDAPVNTVGDPASGREGHAIALTGISVLDIDESDNITVHLSVAHGRLTVLTTGVPGGITAANITGGGNGTGRITLTATEDQINATLAAPGGLTYLGDAGFTGSDALTVSTYDGVSSDPVSLLDFSHGYPTIQTGNILAADLDNDGDLDLLYSNNMASAGRVGFILNRGDGGIDGDEHLLVAGNAPTSLALADINGDGLADIIVTNYNQASPSGGTVGVFLNTGAATFAPMAVVATMGRPFDLVAGDFDQDGRIDLAVVRRDFGAIQILVNGAGGLTSGQSFDTRPAGSTLVTTAIAMADLNGDGDLDLVTVNQATALSSPGNVSIHLGGAGASFGPAIVAAANEPSPVEVAVGDVNGDGKADIAFLTQYPSNGGTVRVMLGSGDGSFAPAVSYAVPGTPRDVAIADANGDGTPDLAVAVYTGGLSVLTGYGNGTFRPAVTISSGNTPESLAAGDLNGDGDIDFAVGSDLLPDIGYMVNRSQNRSDIDTKAIMVTANSAPMLAVPITDPHGDEDTALSYQIPAGALTDADGDALIYTATLANGDPLPAWLAFDAATRTLSGTPPADFNGALSIEVTASDGAASASALFDLVIDPVNDAPVLGGAGAAAGFVEGVDAPSPAIAIAGALTISDLDDTALVSATVGITGNFQAGEDVLAFTNDDAATFGDIAADYDGAAGLLTLTSSGGTATLAQWQAALRAVTYTNTSQEPDEATRTMSFAVHDGEAESSIVSWDVAVTGRNDSPAGADGARTFAEDGVFTFDASHFGFGDADGDAFLGVGISEAPAGGRIFFDEDGEGGDGPVEVAAFPTAIYAAADIAAGKLIFVPTPDLAGAGAASVLFQVLDDGGTAGGGKDADPTPNILTFHITPVNDGPVLTGSATDATFTEGGGPVAVDAGLGLVDVDSHNFSASARFSQGTAEGDLLSFVNSDATLYGSITGTWNPVQRQLDLLGSGTVEQWQNVLRAVCYDTTSDNPNDFARQVTFTIHDGGTGPTAMTHLVRSVNVTPINDAPTVSISDGLAATEQIPLLLRGMIAIGDTDSGSGVITVDLLVDHGVLDASIEPGDAIVAGIGTSGIRITGTLAQVQALLGNDPASASSITYTADTDAPPAAAALTVTVYDEGHSGGSGPATGTASGTIHIAPGNDAPTLSEPTGATLSYIENADRTALFAGVTMSDPDEPDAYPGGGFTLNITGGAGEIGLLTSRFGLTGGGPATFGIFDSVTGQVIGQITGLNGAIVEVSGLNVFATPDVLTALIQSFGLTVAGDNPATGDRTVSLVLDDGGNAGGGALASNQVSQIVQIVAVNDAPTLAFNGSGAVTLQYIENDQPTAIAPLGIVSDPDSANFAGGTLTLSFVNHFDADDRLSILNQGGGPGQIGVSGNMVSFGGTQIGTFAGGRDDSTPLVVSLNESATPAAVTALMRQIAYRTISDNPSAHLHRQVSFALEDNDGGASTGTLVATIEIVAFDDPGIARDDAFATDEAGPIIGSVLADHGGGADTDSDGGLAVAAVNGSAADVGAPIVLDSGALLILNEDGSFEYDPNGAFDETPAPGSGAANGLVADSFTYTLVGGSSAIVTVTVAGLDGDDSLFGTAAANRLNGGIGNDRLQGGGGADVLVGGPGADVFAFTNLADSRELALRSDGGKLVPDRIGDFSAGEDRIDLSSIDAVAGTAGDDPFTFIGTAAFTGQAGQLRYEVRGGWIEILADVDGDASADFHLLAATPLIGAADFIL